MLHISFWQILLIFLVAFLVFGPQQLPKIAKLFGQFLGQVRKTTTEIKNELEQQTRDTDDDDKNNPKRS